MVRSSFRTLCAARNQGAWLRWLLGVWCDCKTSQPRRAVGAGGAARLTQRPSLDGATRMLGTVRRRDHSDQCTATTTEEVVAVAAMRRGRRSSISPTTR